MPVPGMTPPKVATAQPDFSDGIMVALIPEPDLAAKLAVTGGLEPDDLHVTLAFLGDVGELGPDTSDFVLRLLTALREVGEHHRPVRGQFNGVIRFCGGEQDALALSFDAPDLPLLYDELIEALVAQDIEPDATHGFTPHLTLAYLGRSDEAPITRFDPVATEFGALHAVVGEADIVVPLTGLAETTDEGGGRRDPLPGTTSATVNAEPAQSKELEVKYDPSQHPKAPAGTPAGGQFTAGGGGPAPQTQKPLPKDWIDRVIAGDPRYVQAAKGKKGKKGKTKAQLAAAAVRKQKAAARVKAAAARRAAAVHRAAATAAKRGVNQRNATVAKAAAGKKRAVAQAESDRRASVADTFARAADAEADRRDTVQTAIDTETDPKKKAELIAAERIAQRRYAAALRAAKAAERARVRAYATGRPAPVGKHTAPAPKRPTAAPTKKAAATTPAPAKTPAKAPAKAVAATKPAPAVKAAVRKAAPTVPVRRS